MQDLFRANRIILSEQFRHALAVVGFFSLLYTFFFSPVLFSEKLLAAGDGLVFHLPNFQSGIVIWDPLISGGFPVAADLQSCAWYPVWHLFRLLSWWNGFVLSAYVLSACFTYGYVYSITSSKFAALISGIIYSMSGFMLAHLGHATVIHGSIWLPLFIWSLHMIFEKFSWMWFSAGSVALAFGLVCGHPQIPFYTLVVGTIYVGVLGFVARDRLRFYLAFAGILVFGIAIAAIQLLPSAELLQYTVRSKLKYSEFITYSIERYQLLQFIFPYLLGGSMWPFQNTKYFGPYNLAELTGYVGLLPLLLSTVAVVARPKKILVGLWGGIALFALFMALGDATPLGKISYYLPLYNKFRAPARHFILTALAVSVLSGFGIAALQKQLVVWKSVFRIVMASVLIFFAASWIVLYLSSRLDKMAIQASVKVLWFVWSNPTLAIPFVLLVLSAGALFLLHWRPHSISIKVCTVLVLLFDFALFGWFGEWRTSSPPKDKLAIPASLQKYQVALQKDQNRVLSFRGNQASRNQVVPNLSRLWGIANVSIYTPMMFTRLSKMLSMTYWGQVDPVALFPSDRSLDLMAVRYLFLGQTDVRGIHANISRDGLWSSEEFGLSLGNGCGPNQSIKIEMNLPNVIVSDVGIVSDLGCAVNVPDNTEVVRITVTDQKGIIREFNLLAGRDTSEWSIDCMPQTALHRRANIFRSYPYKAKDKDCTIYNYIAKFSLDSPARITKATLEAKNPGVGINIRKLSFWNRQQDSSYQVLAPMAALTDKHRWRKSDEFEDTIVFENRSARPRAWLVHQVVSTDRPLDIIKSSRMPDGKAFQISNVALVEEPFTLKSSKDHAAYANVKEISKSALQIETKSTSSSFLVLSDIYYPGWNAHIDGKKVHIYRTNYISRGVQIPAGRHIVRFEYQPPSLYIGAAISVMSIITMIGLSTHRYFRRIITRSSSFKTREV